MQKLDRIYEAFGPHLVLDGWGCDPQALADLDLVFRFLNDMPDRIAMTPIMPPYVYRFAAGGQGISGFILIAESHIAIHTWPEWGTLHLDIFSCKDFDMDVAVAEVKRRFAIKYHHQEVFDRGLEFPRNVKMVKAIITENRKNIAIRGGAYA